MPKERYPWMDHVKLFASIMIMMGHYHDAAYDFCGAAPAAPAYYPILNGLLVPFQNGKFWIMVFCIISGFLSSKKVRSFKELTLESVFRYLRFLIPLFLVNALSFLLYKSGLYWSGQYGSLMQNGWIGSHYIGPYGLKDVLGQSVFFGAALDTSLWMMRPLFVGNILILLTEYLTRHFPHRRKLLAEAAVLVLLMAGAFRITTLWYCAAVYVGLIYHDTKKNLFKPIFIALPACVVLAVYYLPVLGSIRGADLYWINQPKVDFPMGIIFTFGFFCNNYHGKSFGKINWGAVSFWVFLLHSPVLCSLSCWILLRSLDRFWVGFWLALAAMAVVVIPLSVLLSQTVDIWANKALKKTKQKLMEL